MVFGGYTLKSCPGATPALPNRSYSRSPGGVVCTRVSI